MANGYRVYRLCDACWGKGTVDRSNGEPGQMECPHCYGHKVKFWGWISEDTYDMPTAEQEPPASTGATLKSSPPEGYFKVKNLYVNSDGKFVAEYDDVPA